MRARHPVPTHWLMTDERLGERLWPALAHLPRGGGVVFRHYSLPAAARRALFVRVRQVAQRRRLVLLCAGGAVGRGGAGVHNRRGRGLMTVAVHCASDVARAERAGANAIFVSPVFATRSHPEAKVLGPLGLARIARRARVPVIALGGMTHARFRRLGGLGIHGWGAIDAWAVPRQKRNAVPT